MLKRKKENKSEKSRLEMIGFLLIILSGLVFIGVLSFELLFNKKDNDAINDFYKEQEEIKEIISNEPPEVAEEKIEEIKEENNISYDYIALLKIDKINLERGLVSKDSKYNKVSKNIEILKEADMPDVENGNFILAGHSGSGYTAFFKNLHKLTNEDLVSVFYGGYEYKYKVVNIYDVEKTGTANIIRNKDKTTLTLITCRHNTNKQIIVICELVERV